MVNNGQTTMWNGNAVNERLLVVVFRLNLQDQINLGRFFGWTQCLTVKKWFSRATLLCIVSVNLEQDRRSHQLLASLVIGRINAKRCGSLNKLFSSKIYDKG
jgi:hypothetical protein